MKTRIIWVLLLFVLVGSGYCIWKYNLFYPWKDKIESDEKKIEITDYMNPIYLPYFDIQIGDQLVERIVFQLFDEDVPKTCLNFRYLCVKDIVSERTKKEGQSITVLPSKSSYDNTLFHRVIKNFMIQGGDIINGDGTGGMSLYGSFFDDENFDLKHNQEGILSMANAGPNTNQSQFFITTKEAPWLDGNHVVFGIVISGYDIIEKIQNVECDLENKPLIPVRIVKSGLIENKK